jgi:hypothetical protein
MFNPFQRLTEAFQDDYHVNFSLQCMDGSIMLTLSNEQGPVTKRLISPDMRNDPRRLENLILSIQFNLAVDQGQAPEDALRLLRATPWHSL